MEIPLNKAEQVFNNLKNAFEANLPAMLFNAANVGSAEMQWRVFNQGKAADNSVQHYRSSQYKRDRRDAGLQILYKDFIFSGNLFNSLGLRLRGKDVIEYGFNSSRQAEIAGYQEDASQVGKPIFTLNAEEISVVEKAFKADIARLISAVNSAPLNKPATLNKPDTIKLPAKKTAVEKSIERNKKRKAVEKYRKSLKNIKERESSITKRTNKIQELKKKQIKQDLKLSEAHKAKSKAKSEIKSNEYKRVNATKHIEYINNFIKRKKKYIRINENKLFKSKSGSKASIEYARKIKLHKTELKNAQAKLSSLNALNKSKAQYKKANKTLSSKKTNFTAKIKENEKTLRKQKRIAKLRKKRIYGF